MRITNENMRNFHLRFTVSMLCIIGVISVPLKSTDIDGPTPSFATSSRRLRIPTKDTIVLPCEVNNLGRFVLAWKRGMTTILFAGATKVTPDDRIRLVEGYNLEIRDVQTTDAGDYICHIATLTPKEMTHTLEVLVPPRISRPKPGAFLEVRKGDSVTMECLASGNPTPNITWTKKNDVMPPGDKSTSGSSYTIKQTGRHDSGVYICTAHNGVGSAAQEQINLKINYAPEVEVEKSWVHSGENAEAELVCIVNAEPPATVLWYRNTLQLDMTERRIFENRGSRHTLVLRKVKSDDFGNYSCVADNAIGKKKQDLILSGKAHPAIIVSNQNSRSKDSYNITWLVVSYSPIEEFKVSYRSLSETPSNFPHYTYPSGAKSGRKENEMVYATEYEIGYPRSWKNVTVLPITSHRYNHSMSYIIQDLEPATQYEAKVYSKNRFGWSESESFRFQTRGTDSSSDISNDIFPEPEMRDMGVKSPNTASQLRSGFGIHSNLVVVGLIGLILANN